MCGQEQSSSSRPRERSSTPSPLICGAGERPNSILQTQALEIQDKGQSNGAVWDLDPLSSASNQANAHIQASLQGQWYDTGSLTAADTLIPGHLDIPDDVIERQCLDPACEEQETLEQAKRRIAENHLEGHVSVQQDGDWETFPAREWVDNLR